MVWGAVKIGDYLTETEFRDPTKRPRNRFFYVDVSSVDNQAFAIRQPTELLGADAPSRARKVIRERDVIFATVRPTLRRIAMVDLSLDNQICSTGFCVLRSGARLDARFLYYWLLTDDVVEHVAKIEKGVSYPAIRDSDVKAIRIPYPPLDEQRRIAAVLSVVQRAIEREERLIDLTTELKNALMHKLFTEGTRGEPLKETEIGPVPESWNVIPLGSLAKIGNGSTPKRDNLTYWEDGIIPWLTSGKIHEGRIKRPDQYVTELAKAECHLPIVAAGSVLVAITGEGKTLGNAALVEFDTCVSQHLAYVQFHRRDVVPAFLLYFLQRQYTHLRQMSVGAGSTKKAITCGLLKRYAVPLPSRDEQNLIAAAFDTIGAKFNEHERTAESLRSLFRTLLHELMTARIRIHDLDLSALEEAKQEPVGAI
jgi:type I restriction enzyme S subunit